MCPSFHSITSLILLHQQSQQTLLGSARYRNYYRYRRMALAWTSFLLSTITNIGLQRLTKFLLEKHLSNFKTFLMGSPSHRHGQVIWCFTYFRHNLRHILYQDHEPGHFPRTCSDVLCPITLSVPAIIYLPIITVTKSFSIWKLCQRCFINNNIFKIFSNLVFYSNIWNLNYYHDFSW